MRSTSQTIAAALTTALLVAVGAAGCGNVTSAAADPHSQVAARQAATTATCDRAMACNLIGPGKTYETRASCETQVGSFWDQSWPPAQCEGRIDPAQLNVCLAAIAVADCSSNGNLVLYLVDCPEAKVCDYVPPDAGNGPG